MSIKSVWKIGLTDGMLVLAQKEPFLKAIIKICIKMHKNVFFFFNETGSNLIRWHAAEFLKNLSFFKIIRNCNKFNVN